jgi:methylisocitrate lyase
MLNQRRALPVPGCHDALSARVIASSGFEALQISGFGVAGSLLGKPDVGLVQAKDVLDSAWNIAQAVDIPVMADIDTGGGNALNAAWMTERLIDMGIAGMNIEDQEFPKRCGHLTGKEVIEAAEMIGKIGACAAVRDRKDKDFIINARTDSFATHGIDEAIGRCRQYLGAGADMVFIDAIATRNDIEQALKSVGGLLSVNLMDGVTGVRTELVPIPELAKMGVARVSIPVASVLVAHKALKEFFEVLRASDLGILPGRTDLLSSFDDYQRFVGLDEYQDQERQYLPSDRLEKRSR